jgi:iron complex outermembrane receptor protein
LPVLLVSLAAICRAEDAPVSATTNETSELKKMSLAELLNLEVTTVTRRESTVGDSPAAIFVITQDDIRRSGATSIPEALRLAPGLEVAQADSSTWAISARGFNSTSANKLLVLMDGRSVYAPVFSGVFWDVQDTTLEDIDRIEVIRGPAGALWGANAVNGVINIITKSAQDTQGLLLYGGGGTEERVFGGARFGWKPAEDVYARVYVKQFERDETTVSSNGLDSADAWMMRQGGFRVDWLPSTDNHLTFQGDVYSGERDNRPNFFGRGDTDLFGGNVLGRWSHEFASAGDLQLQTYYDRTERSIPGVFGEDRDTFDVDFQHHIPWGERQNVTWGLGYRITSDQVNNSFVIALDPDHRTTQTISTFIQDEIELVKDCLRLTLGSKFEHNDFTGFEIQPNARLLWKIDKRQTAWAAVSRAVRTPTRLESDLLINFPVGGGTNIVFRGSPEFDSESVIAYELGYRVEPVNWLAFDVATFYNVYDRLASVEQGTPPPSTNTVLLSSFGNKLSGETYGVELGATWKAADWWTIRAAYTFLEEQLHTDSSSTDTNSELSAGNNPHHQFYVRSSVDFPHRVELDCTLRYVDTLPNQNVASYLVADVRLGWRPTKQLELAVVGQNLLDNRHPEFGTGATRHEIQNGVYGKVTYWW